MLSSDRTYYLYDGVNGPNNYGYWTMSASGYHEAFYNDAMVWFVTGDGKPSAFPVYYDNYIRPVINLKADVELEWNRQTSRFIVR